jgi:hypothetical protein
MFLVSLSVLCLYILACNVANILLRTQQDAMQLADAIKATPATMVEAIICFFSMWSILCLCGYHTYLISLEVSTNEDIKKSFSHSENLNPYDRGSIWSNMANVLCSSVPPSLINLRETIPNRFVSDSTNGGNQENYTNLNNMSHRSDPYPIMTQNHAQNNNYQSYYVTTSGQTNNTAKQGGNDVHF